LHVTAIKKKEFFLISPDLVNFQEPGTGPAGIILIFPAGFACPPPAEYTLPELRDRVRGIAEIAGELREAMRILSRRFPLLTHHGDLFFEFTDTV